MPKAILEFTLPEETTEHECAVFAMDMYSALFNIGKELRRERENPQTSDAAEWALEIFSDAIENLPFEL